MQPITRRKEHQIELWKFDKKNLSREFPDIGRISTDYTKAVGSLQ